MNADQTFRSQAASPHSAIHFRFINECILQPTVRVLLKVGLDHHQAILGGEPDVLVGTSHETRAAIAGHSVMGRQVARVVTFGRGCARHAPPTTPAGATPSQPARTPRADPATLSAQPSATRRGSPSQTAVPRPGTSPTPHARQTPASACTARNTATRPSPGKRINNRVSG